MYKRPEAKKDFPGSGLLRAHRPCALRDVLDRPGGRHDAEPLIGFSPHAQARRGGAQKTPIGYQCYFGDDPGVPVELHKGSMAVFQSTLFHRSGPNLSNGMRKAYIAQYSVEGARNAKTGVIFDNGPLIARGESPSTAASIRGAHEDLPGGCRAIARYHAAAIKKLPIPPVSLSLADPNPSRVGRILPAIPGLSPFADDACRVRIGPGRRHRRDCHAAIYALRAGLRRVGQRPAYAL